jgi:hypothetical protein
MLDLAFGLTDTFVVSFSFVRSDVSLCVDDGVIVVSLLRSRLGCQIQLTKDMDGMHIRLPSATRNMVRSSCVVFSFQVTQC